MSDLKFSEFRKATDAMMINNIVGWSGTDNISISRRALFENYPTRAEIGDIENITKGTVLYSLSGDTSVAPSEARLKDKVQNIGNSAYLIGGITMEIGDIASIISLNPFTVVKEGNNRGARGMDGDGAGDMVTPIYDPRLIQQDIFQYVDNKASNYAPSGFGLGELSKVATDLDFNDIVYGGWYAGNNMTNNPTGIMGEGFGIMPIGSNTNYMSQIAMSLGANASIYTRSKLGGVFYGWNKFPLTKVDGTQTLNWIEPVLQNGWTQFNTTGEPGMLKFTRDSSGKVYFRGFLNAPTNMTYGYSDVLTLPDKYLPLNSAPLLMINLQTGEILSAFIATGTNRLQIFKPDSHVYSGSNYSIVGSYVAER